MDGWIDKTEENPTKNRTQKKKTNVNPNQTQDHKINSRGK